MRAKPKRKDGILELPGPRYQATVWGVDHRGKRVKREKSFPTRSLAKAWRNAQKTDLLRGQIHLSSPKVTVDALRVRWLTDREVRVRAKYPEANEYDLMRKMSRHRGALERFIGIVGDDLRITKITSDHFDDYTVRRQAEKRHPRTINRDLTALKQIFKEARGLFPELQHWQPPTVRMLPESKRGRERTLTQREEAQMLEALEEISQDAADFFVLAIDTAMRLNEVLGLQWHNIAFTHDFIGRPGAIDIVARKVDRSKLIPMTRRVKEVLTRRAAELAGGEYVFDQRAGLRGAENVVGYAIKKAAEAAKVAYGRDVPNGWTIHDLRRTAINRMLIRTTFDYITVNKIAGISIEVLLNSYAKTDAERMRAAVG